MSCLSPPIAIFGSSLVAAGPRAEVSMDSILQAALHESAQREAQRRREWQEQVSALGEALRKREAGAKLDLNTPADGHCLFHALSRGGLLAGVPASLTVAELRGLVMNSASPEQLSTAAASVDMTVEQYSQGMRAGDYGDNLVIAVLASQFCKSISVLAVGSARTFLHTGGEVSGVIEDAIWVAHIPEHHYFGVLRWPQALCQSPSPGAIVISEPEKPKRAKATNEKPKPAKATRGLALKLHGASSTDMAVAWCGSGPARPSPDGIDLMAN